MSKLYFSDTSQFKLVLDEAQLRGSALYEQIRNEINRRFRPFSGGPDWEKIRILCERVGASEGVDLLVSIYYTVAAVKTQGLLGLANGLELQVAVNNAFLASSEFPAQRRVELYTWMISRVAPEIRILKASPEQLRELYRCERACQRLYAMLEKHQPDHVPDIESIAFLVFEHIDQLETHRISHLIEKSNIVKTKQKNKTHCMLSFSIGIIVAVLLMISFTHIGVNVLLITE
ncbi:hypothetical protein PCNPT3_08395 [Psychromonas sp. CNPT3]|uniref:type VI secretion system ImpA family N-terminal domain-containing protein n=1 Tax=Psychromonas sp. CNPT3 TaxID=314282 RepID=UPI00006E85EC|nr:type VI secretion system ImpA family N-terminal domain-containing protein [Psychromonas sp. CNPT3]AGH81617.1 hypothetical protein PCNPT3_08395 [Psychromonas sp. CNPT3]